MARDGGSCNICGKHYIHSSKDTGDALRRTLKTIQSREQNLLVIELENETAVPKVFYNGEEITEKVRVSFDWITQQSEPWTGGTKFNIEHIELVNKNSVQKGIGLARGIYMNDFDG